jgi:hypothetical protein
MEGIVAILVDYGTVRARFDQGLNDFGRPFVGHMTKRGIATAISAV